MILIRAACVADQPAIRALVYQAHLNPLNVRWPRFLVAVELGRERQKNGDNAGRVERIVGVGQIRLHRDGTQELASIAVVPEYQGRGIGRAIVATLLSCTQGELYLMCRVRMAPYYHRFGFVHAETSALPASLAWLVRAGNLVARLALFVGRAPVQVVAMQYRPKNNLPGSDKLPGRQ